MLKEDKQKKVSADSMTSVVVDDSSNPFFEVGAAISEVNL